MPFRAVISCALGMAAASAIAVGRVTSMPYAAARPVLEALAAAAPADLRTAAPGDGARLWDAWVARRDRAIRARLDRGDDDTLVHWLLFGTSFTAHPRVDLERPAADPGALGTLIVRRAGDLAAAIARPSGDERARFARRLLEARGLRFDTPAARQEVVTWLLAGVRRVADEQRAFGAELAAARAQPDATGQFAGRSQLFRDRGLSLDTTLFPNLAIERALAALAAAGFLKAGAVRRVAIVGPGLDFTDKLSGFDFYPQQTLQPFAVADSLLRLKLAPRIEDLEIVTFDVSPRVNDHLAAAVRRAASGEAYVLQLPLETARPWHDATIEYWRGFGRAVGIDTTPVTPPAGLEGVRLRAVRVRSEVVRRIQPVDLNIVLQRLDGPAFDLVVATNVFVYYDVFDQSLALANVRAMLRPGGVLLANNALLELDAIPIRSAGYTTTAYSGRPDDGDHVVWYRAVEP
jgi:SAM-dependent methyltransferase